MMELPNRGKRSVGLDMRHAEKGRELLLELCETADVFLTNFRPQARRKLGIDVDDIRAVNPKIIYVRGSGQGQRGPDAERGGYDGCTFWGRGGPADIISNPDEATRSPSPDRPSATSSAGSPLPVGSRRPSSTGSAPASRLHRRQLTPRYLHVGHRRLIHGRRALRIDRMPMRTARRPRTRSSAPTAPPTGASSRSSCWNQTAIGVTWSALLGAPELEHDPRFVDSIARRENAAGLRRHPRRDVRPEDLRRVEVHPSRPPRASGPRCRTRPSSWSTPRPSPTAMSARSRPASGTVFQMIASPVQFDETPPDLIRGPEHGEHTDEVLGELGLDMDALLELKIKGAILSARRARGPDPQTLRPSDRQTAQCRRVARGDRSPRVGSPPTRPTVAACRHRSWSRCTARSPRYRSGIRNRLVSPWESGAVGFSPPWEAVRRRRSWSRCTARSLRCRSGGPRHWPCSHRKEHQGRTRRRR